MPDSKQQSIHENGTYFLESSEDALETIQLLEDKIYEFNSAKINKPDGHLFTGLFKDDSGEIIAGIGGWTWAGACEVTQLWVDEKHRRKGIGEILLNASEEQAINKGCLIMLIRTYSFQAPDFYLNHGFKLEHEIKNFPDGHNYYTLIKKLPDSIQII
jgi:GNAT superfamily N-acetyltransferase